MSQLNQLLKQLIKQGVAPDKAAQVASTYLQKTAGANAGGVGSKAAMNPITREIIGELVGGGLLAGGASLVGGLGGAPGAATIAPRGKDYIMGPEAMRQSRKDYYSPYNTAGHKKSKEKGKLPRWQNSSKWNFRS